ncbi:MAG: YebC/PmpR family DNA-binding transcriptional regulator [Kofleriaceae bacterium]
MGAQWKHAGRVAAGNAKGKVFSKLAKEIIVAAKNGADPANNVRLRIAVDAAKKASMTKDTIERSIKRGAGLLDGAVQYETVVYEGFAPHRVPVIVECLTDNRNRTATSVRVLFRKGQLGNTGSVSWDFDNVGIVDASPGDGAGDAETAAIEAGAQDVEPGEDEGTMRFYTEPTDLDLVQKALAAQGWNVAGAFIGYKPKNPVTVDDDAARAEVVAFLEALDADDDVQRLYVGLA